jgi:hypothetical protein
MALTRQIAGDTPSPADARGAGWRDAMLEMSTVIAPPTLVLLVLMILYALVPIVCTGGTAWVLPLICAIGIAICLAFYALAASHHRRYDLDTAIVDPSVSRARFVTAVGRLSSLLSALVIVAMLVATLVINPCERL